MARTKTFIVIIVTTIVGVALAAWLVSTGKDSSSNSQKARGKAPGTKGDPRGKDEDEPQDDSRESVDLVMESIPGSDNKKAVPPVNGNTNEAVDPNEQIHDYEFILNDELSAHFLFMGKNMVCYHDGQIPPAVVKSLAIDFPKAAKEMTDVKVAFCKIESCEIATAVFASKEVNLSEISTNQKGIHLVGTDVIEIPSQFEEIHDEVTLTEIDTTDIFIDVAETEIVGAAEFTVTEVIPINFIPPIHTSEIIEANFNVEAVSVRNEIDPVPDASLDFTVASVCIRNEIEPIPKDSLDPRVKSKEPTSLHFNLDAPVFVPASFSYPAKKVKTQRKKKSKTNKTRNHFPQPTLGDFINGALSAADKAQSLGI